MPVANGSDFINLESFFPNNIHKANAAKESHRVFVGPDFGITTGNPSKLNSGAVLVDRSVDSISRFVRCASNKRWVCDFKHSLVADELSNIHDATSVFFVRVNTVTLPS